MGDTRARPNQTHMTGQTPDGMEVRVEFSGPRTVALSLARSAELLWDLLEAAEVASVRTHYADMRAQADAANARRAATEGRTDG